MSDETLSLKKIQGVELKMLEFLDSICEDANIDYCLAYGSALGAYRHAGFIPWDDDMDVYIRRRDSKRLFDLLDERGDGRYKVLRPCKTDGYFHPYAKLTDCSTQLIEPKNNKVDDMGVFIDLFLCDTVDNDCSQIRHRLKILNFLNKIYCQVFVRNHEHSSLLLRTACGGLSKILNPIKAHQRIELLIEKMATDNGQYFVCPYDADYCIPVNWVFPTSKLQFEQRRFNVPGRIEQYLESMYGSEYMTPIRDDNSFHGIVCNRCQD